MNKALILFEDTAKMNYPHGFQIKTTQGGKLVKWLPSAALTDGRLIDPRK